ncbi:posphoenolpyruvate synthetase regulatory kinase/phosphorylase PpsR [Actinobacillus vicugnae]|uniref:posphoenolpyruvate synthetase regulatory kinase/phosphorylase PpsR n=1 Tax=Actinobacillus vicugnae TaxID=2573093 RepID=UPI001240AC09|nr:pyruvate, water dikinase regulatory protein [Actinobacillus vicugnae]
MPNTRHAFFISDRTGITAENLGNALLEQFAEVSFKRTTCPFIDTAEKAHQLVAEINTVAEKQPHPPILFMSVVNEQIREILKTSKGVLLNFFDTFLTVLEQELEMHASHQIVSRVHNVAQYDERMEAVNFALNHDDGVSDKELKQADVILLGVSRSGKTPTCLYLALQYGIRAANYPLTPEDLASTDLPKMIKPYRNKLYGLTIKPDRLHDIRQERRPDSNYADIKTCRSEILEAQAMFRRYNIPYTNTTHQSVEELAVAIMQACKLKRRF